MPRYIEIEQRKLKELTKQVQLFQDDIVCGIGTDFMQKIATAENKLLFDIVKGLATEPTADVVPRSEVEKAKQEVATEMCKLVKQFFEEHYYLEKPKKVTIENLHIEFLKKYSFESCEVERFIAELRNKYIGEKS